ncbi:MAG TPA: hypothetical protein VLA92_00235 [Candidatus Saccharimonadales bacterium]|nr:hypothetical protein [Candidatus Saccharimonadales bacterium]
MTALYTEQYLAAAWEDPEPSQEILDPVLAYEYYGQQNGYWRSNPEDVPIELRDHHCQMLGYSPYTYHGDYASSQTYIAPAEPQALQDTGQHAFEQFWYDGNPPQANSTRPSWAETDSEKYPTSEPEVLASIQAPEVSSEQLAYERGRHRRKEKSLVRKGLETAGCCLGGAALGAIIMLAYGIATRR